MYLVVISVIWISSISAIQMLQNDCSTHLDSFVCEHNVPRNIPDDIKSVTVQQMINGSSDEIIIHSDLFIGRNWDKVERLTLFVLNKTSIISNAFYKLRKLLYLAIHNNLRIIESDGFVGLQQLEILDLRGCRDLYLNIVTAALNGPEKMPLLQELYLVNLNIGQSLTFDRTLFSVLATKNITTIDFSKTSIQSIDFPALFDTLCSRPLTFRLSMCNIFRMRRTYRFCSKMRMLDISYARLNLEPLPSLDNVVLPVGPFLPLFSFFFHIESLIADCVIQDYTIHVHNLSLLLMVNDTSTIQNLSLADNQLHYFDARLLNFPRSLQRLNLSSNGMLYFQPHFLFENNSLTSLDLSHNNLCEMGKANSSDFGILIRVYRHLQQVYLSYNRLTFIPIDLFVGNPQLFLIDLSHNELGQVEFDLERNNELQYLNLSYNMITTLSESSLHTIQRLAMKKPMFTVDIRNNDIRCDTCACKDSIQWILKSKNAVITDMICRRSDGKTVMIDDKTLTSLNDMCQREKLIVIGTLVTLAGVILLVIITFNVQNRLRRSKRIRTRNEVIQMIQERRHQFRFVTFLAFSGEDEFFVDENVRKPLENQLREMTGTDRDLVCTGNRHFQLGCTIGAQMESCCHKCGSVILVISPAFCNSPYCNNEMNIAYTCRKPIVLMFKEHVEENEMTPLLRVIFKQYTRVTWTARGDEYALSTSWENICESLIDRMISTEQ